MEKSESNMENLDEKLSNLIKESLPEKEYLIVLMFRIH